MSAAVRMEARQRGQVLPVHQAVSLRPEPGQHAGVRQPIHRIDAGGTSGSELGLDAHPRDVRGVDAAAHDRADLVVVDAERDGHRQRGEDARGGQAVHGELLQAHQIAAAVRSVGAGLAAVVLQVHLDLVAMVGEPRQQDVVLGDLDAVGVQQDPIDRPGCDLVQDLAATCSP